MPAINGSVTAFVQRRIALSGILVTAAAAALATLLRYQLVEPEAMGSVCKPADAPWWCPWRTGLIVTTEWNGLGYAALFLVALSFALPRRWAVPALLGTALFGGLGLVLYNATESALPLVLALLRAAWLERRSA